MPDLLSLLAILFALSSLALLIAGLGALRRRRVLGSAGRLMLGTVLLAWAALFAVIGIGIRGYKALTGEQLAAVIETTPDGPGHFRARFRFPDGSQRSFELAGDQLYVDAYILKWKPIANFFGLQTAYKLDRVAGRYRRLSDEQHRPHTVFALQPDAEPVDLFDLRNRYRILSPLLDAEYGSATYIAADRPQHYELRVSTTGLLIRAVGG
jgi:hypothetical protein